MYVVLAMINNKFLYVIHYIIDPWTHVGLMTQYGDIDANQHWLSLWLVAWGPQAITWTKHDFIKGFCGFI